MLRIAVVEDEKALAQQTEEYVNRYLAEHGLEGSVTVFYDGMDLAENYHPIWDVLLLDIEMPLLDGMSTAQSIREQDSAVVMIFITRMARYAIRGYEVDALDFVLKPISYAQLSMKLRRALERVALRQKHHLMVTVKGGQQRIETDSIFYIEVKGHWLFFHTSSQLLQVAGSMQQLEEKLEGQPFSRCSNSYLVNLRHVTSVRKDTVVVAGEELPLSRGRRTAFLEELANYMVGGNGT